jgi:hypothetical protein
VEDARVNGSAKLPRTIFALLAVSAMTLGACSPKTPPEPAAASDVAPSDTAASDAASGQAAADAAISSAAAPAAGTVANDKGDNQKTIKPTASVSEEARAAGDEAPQDLKAKVQAAQAAGRAPVAPKH